MPRATRPRSPHLRRSWLLGHVLGSGLFLGGTAAVTLLGAAGEGAGGAHRAFAYAAALQVQWLVLLPGAVAAVASGFALALPGPGLVRRRWMVAKLAGTALLALHSQVEFRPLTARLAAMAATVPLPEGYADASFHFLRVGVIQVAVIVGLSALGLFKPWGRTRFGRAAAKEGLDG